MSCQQNQQQCQLPPKCPIPKCPLKCPQKCASLCPPPIPSCCGSSSGGCCNSGGGGCCLSHHRHRRPHCHRPQSSDCCGSGSSQQSGGSGCCSRGGYCWPGPGAALNELVGEGPIAVWCFTSSTLLPFLFAAPSIE
ncbi:late cornified envelope protein 4A [Chlorocebus sabaeus]|uniref:late cornified envelope protein 4A n=1 Tax=Chlorocebus sabaeus TaxID=60711 RepID=UPI003BF9EAB1